MIKAVKQKCLSGNVIDVTIKPKSGDHTGRRRKKMNITAESVRQNNLRLAKKTLARIINANFGRGDVSLTLTYDNDRTVYSEEDAEQEMRRFLARLKRRALKKYNKDLKFVYVTEGITSGKRIHHHMVVNVNDIALIEEAWTAGYIRISALDETGDYTRLAEYMMKEQGSKKNKAKYHSSRNLIRPQIREKEADIEEIEEDPIPDKGYYIPKDSVRRFEHPVTGLMILEYRMVKLEGEQGKKWLKGKKATGKESYKPNYEEEQLGLESQDWDIFGF